MRILCFGSLNIDFVYQVPHFVSGGETLAASSLNRFSGGKGLNQSIALAKAGMEVCHAGAIGIDGTFLLEELRAAGVDTGYVKVLEDVRTGHAIIQKNGDGENCILLYGGANQQIMQKQIKETLASFGSGDALILQNEISGLPCLVKQAREQGMTIALNPSPMEDTLLSLVSSVDYLLLNEIEAAQLLYRMGKAVPKEAETLAALLRESLPETAILLTLGKQGSLYAGNAGQVRQKALAVQAVDTTAAGDTYTGFFLAGIFGGQSVEQAMEYASVASAIAVARPGAAPSIPTRNEVLAMMKWNRA